MKKISNTIAFTVVASIALLLGCNKTETSQWKEAPFEGAKGGEAYSLTRDDSKNQIKITCSDDMATSIDYIKDGVSINGKKIEFALDGKSYKDQHINENCKVCAENFVAFWEGLRNAKEIAILHNGKQDIYKTDGALKLPDLQSSSTSCMTAWDFDIKEGERAEAIKKREEDNIKNAWFEKKDWNFMINTCTFNIKDDIKKCTPDSVEDQNFDNIVPYKIYSQDRMMLNIIIGKKTNSYLPSHLKKSNIFQESDIEFQKSSKPDSVLVKIKTPKGCIIVDEFSMVEADLYENSISMTGDCDEMQKRSFEQLKQTKRKIGYLRNQN